MQLDNVPIFQNVVPADGLPVELSAPPDPGRLDRFLEVLVDVADSAGSPIPTSNVTAQKARARLNSRELFTGNSLANKLLRVSAFYQEICMMQEVLRTAITFLCAILTTSPDFPGSQSPHLVPRPSAEDGQ